LNIFHNYQLDKLDIQNPDIANYIIIVVFICIAIGFLKRNPEPIAPLCKLQTDQLKGIAILMVIIGHLWVHISAPKIPIVFSGDAVALFLFLSGYGLSISDNKKAYTVNIFFSKRIRRVMIPYWGTTIVILFLDYLILNKIHSARNTIITFLGINMNTETQHIDYVRWYITFILLWYVLYYCSRFFLKDSARLLFLFTCAGISFLLSYYILHSGWYQFFAFPLGCTVALKYEWLRKSLLKRKVLYTFLAIFAFILAILYKIAMFDLRTFTYLDSHFPSIILSLTNELHSILLCAGLVTIVVVFGYRKRYSAFLVFCGGISYELFLLHGAFLVRYNPIITSTDPVFLTANFMLFTFSLMLLSYLYQKFIIRIW